MSLPFLPYGRQVVEQDDVDAVVAALADDFLTSGPKVDAFERMLADTVGAAEAVVCNSGTAALHIAVRAAGLGEGDVAVVPAVTFLATANACRFAGADVVFADVDPDSGLMTADTLRDAARRAGRPVKLVLPVHYAGQAVDCVAIADAAAELGAQVIEDACHALGSRTAENALVGGETPSLAACLSFHPVKTVTTAEGGAVVTNDSTLAAAMRRLRNHGMTRVPAEFQNRDLAFDTDGSVNPWYYELHDAAPNYRLPDLLCALGMSQLAKLPRFLAARARLADRYAERLATLAPLVRPLARRGGQPGWHLAVALIDFEAAGLSRRQVMEALRVRGIGTQVHYIPVHLQPYYRQSCGDLRLLGAEEFYRRALSLPLFPTMTTADVDRVVDALAEVLVAPGS